MRLCAPFLAVLLALTGCQSTQTTGLFGKTSDEPSRSEFISRIHAATEEARQTPVDYRIQEAAQLLQAGRDNDALTVLAQFLRDQPDSVPALRLMVQASRRSGNWPHYNAALLRLMARQPSDPTVQNQCGKALLQLVRLQRHSLEGSRQSADAALAALRRAATLEPQNPRFAQDLFVALVEQNQTTEAEAVLLSALGHCPDDSQLPMAAARYYEAIGRWDDAVRHYDTALQRSPRDRLWRRQRGVCHARLKNHEAACDDLAVALTDRPVMGQLTEFMIWADAAYQSKHYADCVDILDRVATEADHRTPDTEMQRIQCLLALEKPQAASEVALQAMIDWPRHIGLRRLATTLERTASTTAPRGSVTVAAAQTKQQPVR